MSLETNCDQFGKVKIRCQSECGPPQVFLKPSLTLACFRPYKVTHYLKKTNSQNRPTNRFPQWMETNQEKEIIIRVLQGKKEDFALLVEQYQTIVFNLIYSLTGSLSAAEDLAQETFVRAFQHLQRFDTQRRFFPWLYKICLNLCRNHLKKIRRAPSNPSDAENISERVTPFVDPADNLAQAAQFRQVHAAVQTLPLEYREAVTLRFYQELSFEDVAAVLDISLSAAKMRVYRGLEKLRIILENIE